MFVVMFVGFFFILRVSVVLRFRVVEMLGVVRTIGFG